MLIRKKFKIYYLLKKIFSKSFLLLKNIIAFELTKTDVFPTLLTLFISWVRMNPVILILLLYFFLHINYQSIFI